MRLAKNGGWWEVWENGKCIAVLNSVRDLREYLRACECLVSIQAEELVELLEAHE